MSLPCIFLGQKPNPHENRRKQKKVPKLFSLSVGRYRKKVQLIKMFVQVTSFLVFLSFTLDFLLSLSVAIFPAIWAIAYYLFCLSSNLWIDRDEDRIRSLFTCKH